MPPGSPRGPVETLLDGPVLKVLARAREERVRAEALHEQAVQARGVKSDNADQRIGIDIVLRAMEQPLTASERLLLSLHLMMCKRCTSFSQQIEFLRRASRKIPEVLEKDAD